MALTHDDVEAIQKIVKVTVDEAIDERGLVTKEDLKHLPNQDDFYSKMDEVMGELKAIREETAAVGHRLENHEDRIEKIESHLGLASD